MSKKVTTEEIKERIINIHGNIYNLDDVIYINNKEKLRLKCSIHGVFDISIGNLIGNKRGCQKCSINKLNNNNFEKYKNEFIDKCKAKLGDDINYNKMIYINRDTSIILTCIKHGDFEILPINILMYNGGCNKCKKDKREIEKSSLELDEITKIEEKSNEKIKTEIEQSKKKLAKYPYKVNIKELKKKIFIEKFFNDVNILHNFKYDYSKSIYNRIDEKIVIICEVHGRFEQTPHHHKNGNGCPACSRKNQFGRYKYSISDIKNFFRKKHGNFYNYDKVDSSKRSDKVIISCPLHGDFKQSIDNHLIGSGCKECGKTKLSESHKLLHKNYKRNNINTKKYTNDEFIDLCNIKHNNYYDYCQTIYNGMKENIIVGCPIHGDYSVCAYNHLNGIRCNKCSLDSKKRTKLDVIIECNKIHNNRYTYIINDEYIGSNDFINIECSEHGVFQQVLDSHLRGSGCSLCNTKSRGEISILNYLSNNNILYIREKIFNDCFSNSNSKLRYDFYLPYYNVCIEFDGKQHFEPVEYFGGVETFKKTVENDIIKNNYCLDKNIKLIRISYKNLKNIHDILKNKLLNDKLET